MDEERKAEGTRPDEEPSKQGGSSEKSGEVPLAGTRPTGQSPQGTGRGEPGGSTHEPGQGGKGGSGYQPGQSEKAGGMTSRPGQVDGQGGPGDRTNLSGQGGPEKSNWNQDTGKGTEEPES